MAARVIVVGTVSDDPLSSDVSYFMGQKLDISDVIALKNFANSEFCPRFLCDENDMEHIGDSLKDKDVVIVSSCSGEITRNARAMRTFLVARAAKDNGARNVFLVEPDLFYSAQDRGPRESDGNVAFSRTREDYKKFDGQPFSARLYSELLHASGVDGVMTIHNHSVSVQDIFNRRFNGNFFNLSPAGLYADYLMKFETVVNGEKSFILCAPDKGAAPFVREVHAHTSELARKNGAPTPDLLIMDKHRSGERKVTMVAAENSPISLEEIQGREVIVMDDMVRTGTTIVECCRQLKEAGAARIVFVVTHFYSSPEVKENLNSGVIDDIITTDTLPNILNRDMQGRLRRKILILKLERWIAHALKEQVFHIPVSENERLYSVDVSRKNPRWRAMRGLQDED